MDIVRRRIDLTSPVKTLTWRGDALFDMARGERTIPISGAPEKRRFSGYGPRFDRGAACPAGCHQAIYQTLGTKAVLRTPSDEVRELDRSYYCADAYEYPIAIFQVGDRTLVAHCPTDYNVIHLDDADSGERLTASHRLERADDFFHSRLEASPDGRFLLSAGWVWHPWEGLCVFDVSEALADPAHLDRGGIDAPGSKVGSVAGEVAPATFLDESTVVVATKDDDERLDDPEPDTAAVGGRELATWSLRDKQWVTRAHPRVPLGTIMAFGSEHVVSFFEHPRLLNLETGVMVEEWPEIGTGRQRGALLMDDGSEGIPPIARDPFHARFAVAAADHIDVIELAP
jgi:hypothetical protein